MEPTKPKIEYQPYPDLGTMYLSITMKDGSMQFGKTSARKNVSQLSIEREKLTAFPNSDFVTFYQDSEDWYSAQNNYKLQH
jgi:hypothetical protein